MITYEQFCEMYPHITPHPKLGDFDNLKPGITKVLPVRHIAVSVGAAHQLMNMKPVHSEGLENFDGLDWELFTVNYEGTIDGVNYYWGMFVEGVGAFNVMVVKEFTRELTQKERDTWSKKTLGMYGSHSGKYSYSFPSGVANN